MANRWDPKWWWVWHINCDCASYDWPKTYRDTPKQCRGCRKALGPLSVSFIGKVWSKTSQQAVRDANAGQVI